MLMNKILRYLFVALMAMVIGNVYADDVTDVLTWDKLLESGKSAAYQDFSGKSITSSAVYAGQASSGSDSYIQLRTNNSNSGIVTTTSGGKLKSVKVAFNSKTTDRSIEIYGSNTAYTAATDLYDEAKAGTKLGSIAANENKNVIVVEGDYTFVGLRSANGAIYVDKIEITWEATGGSQGGQEQGQGQVWDFTILPTQKIDATGNMETNAPDGVFTEDEGAGWQQAYNQAGIADGSEFMATATEVFAPFKGLKWSAMESNKMVFYRNYPSNYGGKHLAFNKAAEVMIPAKAGQVIEMIVASSKSGGTTKKITSQDVVETFDDGGGIKIEFTTAYEYQTITLTAKVDNPYLAFESTFCVQKITVKDAAPVTPTLWDFTILPTQKIDATGNMETNAPDGVFTEDEGAGWQQAYNQAGIADGSEFMATATEVFEPFKGLKWSAMESNKMVFYRNYPSNYGGKHLAFNKAAEVMIPAKAGQVIEMVVASSKSGGTTKKITSQDVVETFDESNGIKIEFTTAYEYQTITLTAKNDNPYLAFESTFCVQKIEVKDAGSTPAEQGKKWDFTKWSDATIENLKADAAASKLEGWSDVEKKTDAEAGADPTEASKDNCFWCVAEPNADGEMSANGVVIAELKGLKFYSVYSTARSLAIAVNYPSTTLGDYAGGAYLWLGGGKKKVPCFAIPSVVAGSTITMEVESHKPAEGRGVELYTGLSEDGKTVDDATKIGDTFTPTAKESHSWEIANDCDVIVYNTNGCHIYTIKVETGTTAINTVKATTKKSDAIFNLAGQKVGKDYKGIVIMNGKKYMQK